MRAGVRPACNEKPNLFVPLCLTMSHAVSVLCVTERKGQFQAAENAEGAENAVSFIKNCRALNLKKLRPLRFSAISAA
jgi:hypothetical protein